jgi:CheY-like chemotaxis protein
MKETAGKPGKAPADARSRLAEEVDILLVEDNPNDAELTQRALRKSGFGDRVLVVRDGAEALDYLFARGPYARRNIHNRPKVMFLDLKLPKVDGMEVLRRIRSDDRLKSMPVVVLTSSNEERDVAECYKLGVNSYVVKPVDFDSFYKSVGDLGTYWLVLNKAPQ